MTPTGDPLNAHFFNQGFIKSEIRMFFDLQLRPERAKIQNGTNSTNKCELVIKNTSMLNQHSRLVTCNHSNCFTSQQAFKVLMRGRLKETEGKHEQRKFRSSRPGSSTSSWRPCSQTPAWTSGTWASLKKKCK